MRLSRRSLLSCVLATAVTMTGSLAAQPAASYKTGADFYMAYRAAFTAAKTIDDVLPWMAKTRRDQMANALPAERTQIFELIKTMDDHTGIRVVKETPSATGAELLVEATSGASKSKATGVVTLVKEGGAWKLDGEAWKGKM
jgi:hypothetical protein